MCVCLSLSQSLHYPSSAHSRPSGHKLDRAHVEVYRVVLLDLTPEILVVYMLFERCFVKIGRDLLNNTKPTSISGV